MDNHDQFRLQLEKISKELKLILKILEENSNLSLLKDFQNIDWNLFLDLSVHHRLYPLLYGKLTKIEGDIIPSSVIQTLEQAFKKNTFQMLYLSSEMELLSNVFSSNQIKMLVLKGPVLAKDLFGDLSLRTCGDLDILVSINDLEKVDEILQRQGYFKKDYINMTLDDWKWRNHHSEYFNYQKGINIEIHWRLNPFPGNGPSFDNLWLRRRISTLTNSPVYYLGVEDLFLFLVSHGARHGWFRLRWLIDIAQILKQKIDWNYLIKQLKRYQYLQVGGQALILSSVLLKTPVKQEMVKLINGRRQENLAQAALFYLEKMVNIHTDPVPQKIADYHKKYLFNLKTIRQKFLYIISFLYPYPVDAETLPLPKHLHLLYFPLRPFLWAWRKTKKQALS
jgi:hypothetical protein